MVQHLETGRLSSSGQASQCADSAGSCRPARRGLVSGGGAGSPRDGGSAAAHGVIGFPRLI